MVVGSSPTLGVKPQKIIWYNPEPTWRNWIARRTSNPEVASSILAVGTSKINLVLNLYNIIMYYINGKLL